MVVLEHQEGFDDRRRVRETDKTDPTRCETRTIQPSLMLVSELDSNISVGKHAIRIARPKAAIAEQTVAFSAKGELVPGFRIAPRFVDSFLPKLQAKRP